MIGQSSGHDRFSHHSHSVPLCTQRLNATPQRRLLHSLPTGRRVMLCIRWMVCHVSVGWFAMYPLDGMPCIRWMVCQVGAGGGGEVMLGCDSLQREHSGSGGSGVAQRIPWPTPTAPPRPRQRQQVNATDSCGSISMQGGEAMRRWDAIKGECSKLSISVVLFRRLVWPLACPGCVGMPRVR
jgi:hypothetical protein